MLEDISYKDYKKKNDIHGTILYPAVMVAPIEKDILIDLTKKKKISSIFDPFCGSGTSLYEASEISSNINLVGCDINPLANLITKVKLQGVTPGIYDDIEKLKILVNNKIDNNYSFKNINKWFRKDIVIDLRKIRNAIINIKDTQNRLYFWYMLCDVVRKYSNTRSSTYKLHIKKDDSINNMYNNILSDYFTSIKNNANKFNKGSNNFKLFKCDILKKIKDFDSNSFDISITSPPYGDNATTVTYGQFSMLQLYWIDKNDLELEGWEFDNYSKIDSKSIGGSSKPILLNELEYNLISPYLNKICNSKKKKVIRYFNDYFIFLRELCRVTHYYIVMTLGNRTVDGVNIDLTNITKIFLEKNNFINRQLIEREIPYKRTPPKTSKVNNKSVSSINFEYIIIHENIKDY